MDFLPVTVSNLIFIRTLNLSLGSTQKASALRTCHSCGCQFIQRGGSDIRGLRELVGLFGLESENLQAWRAVSPVAALEGRGRN